MFRKELDLHGIKHEDVKNELIRFIEANIQMEEELLVITGYSAEMRRIVATVCAEYGFMYTVGSLIDSNKGYVIISLF